MSVKKLVAVVVVCMVLTSCSSRGWSCKSRYANNNPVITEKKAV